MLTEAKWRTFRYGKNATKIKERATSSNIKELNKKIELKEIEHNDHR